MVDVRPAAGMMHSLWPRSASCSKSAIRPGAPLAEVEALVDTSVDPVSQRPVDKATAVIGKTATGTALYFENEQNLLAYSPQ